MYVCVGEGEREKITWIISGIKIISTRFIVTTEIDFWIKYKNVYNMYLLLVLHDYRRKVKFPGLCANSLG